MGRLKGEQLQPENVQSNYGSHWKGFFLTQLMQWLYNTHKATDKQPEIVSVILKITQKLSPGCRCLESWSGLSCLHFPLGCEKHSLAGWVLLINYFCSQWFTCLWISFKLMIFKVLLTICKYVRSWSNVLLGTKIPSRNNLKQACWTIPSPHPLKHSRCWVKRQLFKLQ